jgi:hypothetical protein
MGRTEFDQAETQVVSDEESLFVHTLCHPAEIGMDAKGKVWYLNGLRLTFQRRQ